MDTNSVQPWCASLRDAETVVAPSGQGALHIRAGAAGTGGALSVVEASHQPGAGTPWHLHWEVDEAFYVLEGSYNFHCEDSVYPAGPGSLAFLPRGRRHRYQAGPTGGRLLLLFVPGGTEGYFLESAKAAAAGSAEPALRARLAHKYGFTLLEDTSEQGDT